MSELMRDYNITIFFCSTFFFKPFHTFDYCDGNEAHIRGFETILGFFGVSFYIEESGSYYVDD